MAIDLDPQGHLASSLGLRHGMERGIDCVLLDRESIDHMIIKARSGLDVIVAGQRLAEVERLAGGAGRGRLFMTVIRESAGLAEAPGFGQTIFEYRKKSKGAEDYLALATALLSLYDMNKHVASVETE